MNLFIDTNIFLSFLEVSGKDGIKTLDELEKLVNEKKLFLIFPKITQDEFIRNISKVILEFNANISFPKNSSNAPILENKKELKSKLETIRKQYAELMKEFKKEYLSVVEQTKARIEQKLFKIALYPMDETKYYKQSFYRKLIGNPPGSGGTIGDQLEWEIILNEYIDKDLTIITNDPSWKDISDETKLHPFLKNEWKQKTNKELMFFSTLGEFINKYTKTVKITEDEIKNEEQRTSFIETATQDIPLNGISTIGSANASISARARIINQNTYASVSHRRAGSLSYTHQNICTNCGIILIEGYNHLGLCPDCM